MPGVTEGTQIPPFSICFGLPAKVIKMRKVIKLASGKMREGNQDAPGPAGSGVHTSNAAGATELAAMRHTRAASSACDDERQATVFIPFRCIRPASVLLRDALYHYQANPSHSLQA